MKNNLVELLKTVFGICLMYSVLVGALVFTMYLIGFVAGGTLGTTMAIQGAKIMNTAITISAVGSFFGVIAFYIEDKHELTMENDKSVKG